MADQIHPGELVRLTASFTDPDGQPANPSECRLRVRAGSEPEQVVECQQDGVGEYHADYTVPFAGPAFRVRYRWEGEGVITAVLEGEFEVRSHWDQYTP